MSTDGSASSASISSGKPVDVLGRIRDAGPDHELRIDVVECDDDRQFIGVITCGECRMGNGDSVESARGKCERTC